MRRCPSNCRGADQSLLCTAACAYIAVDISGFICQLKNWSHLQPLLPPHCNWWKDETTKIVCSGDWIGVLAFLTELAIFKLSEASGCLCCMDYTSLSYGLDTSLANCVKLGEATGQWEQSIRNLLEGVQMGFKLCKKWRRWQAGKGKPDVASSI